MVEDRGLEGYKGRHGLFLLKRMDGRTEAYVGEVILTTPTHVRLRLRDGKECDLLLTDVQKIEWQNGGRQ